MKKKITLIGVLVLSIGFFSWNSFDFKKFSSQPPAAKTGAPGEDNCTQCHGGSVGTGNHTITFSGANDLYLPNQTYTMTLSLAGSNAKNGFQIVALRDSDNTGVGSWNATGGDEATMNDVGLARNYIGHSSAGLNQTSWDFEWNSPAQAEGDITFYVITNETNDDGGTAGDVVSTSIYRISENTAAIKENEFADVQILFNGNSNEIQIQGLNTVMDNATLKVINLSGKTVERKKVNGLTDTYAWSLKKNHAEGIYLISVQNNEHNIVRKVFIK